MSIVYWDREGHFKCPHCGKKIKVSEQESEGYGQNFFIHGKKGDFVDVKWK